MDLTILSMVLYSYINIKTCLYANKIYLFYAVHFYSFPSVILSFLFQYYLLFLLCPFILFSFLLIQGLATKYVHSVVIFCFLDAFPSTYFYSSKIFKDASVRINRDSHLLSCVFLLLVYNLFSNNGGQIFLVLVKFIC